jgi:hypothetical protein
MDRYARIGAAGMHVHMHDHQQGENMVRSGGENVFGSEAGDVLL